MAMGALPLLAGRTGTNAIAIAGPLSVVRCAGGNAKAGGAPRPLIQSTGGWTCATVAIVDSPVSSEVCGAVPATDRFLAPSVTPRANTSTSNGRIPAAGPLSRRLARRRGSATFSADPAVAGLGSEIDLSAWFPPDESAATDGPVTAGASSEAAVSSDP